MSISETTLLSSHSRQRILEHFAFLYGNRADDCMRRLCQLIARHGSLTSRSQAELWSHRDAILITYADQVRSTGLSPLASLDTFLYAHRLKHFFSTVHVLPFFPSSSFPSSP